MASSKRSRASRTNTPRGAAPKAVSAPHAPHEAQTASLASAILRQPSAVLAVPGLLSEPVLSPKPAPTPAPQIAAAPVSQVAAPSASKAALTPASQSAPVSQIAAPPAPQAAPARPTDELRSLVAQLAYLRAERMGFGRTNPTEDWLWAEQEVTRRMQARAA